MGLHLTLKPKPCETCGHHQEPEEFYITYNLAPMWYRLYPDHEEMIPIDGQSGAESKDLIKEAARLFIRLENELRPLEPTNGFGTYKHFLSTLHNMRDACVFHPDWTWEVSR